jgi:hypothetical protein
MVAGEHDVGDVRRSIVDGAEGGGFDDDGPAGEPIATGGLARLTDHVPYHPYPMTGERSDLGGVFETAVADGPEEFRERKVGDALGRGRKGSG